MKNTHRIEFTETSLFAGNMVDRKQSTKWMTKEEAMKSQYMLNRNAKIIER